MPRVNSQTRSVWDDITATALQDINEDLDDIYANGSDRLRVYRAVSWTALRVDIGAGAYYVGSTQGIYAGSVDNVVVNAATNYVMIDNAGAISINQSWFTAGLGRLATVTCAGGAVTSIVVRTDVVFGWAALDLTALTADTNPNRANDKILTYDASAAQNKAVTIEDAIKTATVTCTAGESITAGDLLYMDIDASVYKTVRKCSAVAQLWTITGLDSWTHTGFFTQCWYLSDNVAVTAYKKSADNKVYASIATFTRGTPSVGTESSAITGALETSGWFMICVLSATLFVISYKLASDDKLYAVACTVSWSTITVGTPVKMYDTYQIWDFTAPCKVTSTSFAIGFEAQTLDDMYCVVGTISGTTITAGTAVAFKALGAAVGAGIALTYIEDGVIAGAYDNWTVIYVRFATISGSTITMKTESTVTVTWTLTYNDQLFFVETGQLMLIDNDTNGVNRIVTWNMPDQSSWGSSPVFGPVVVNTFYITNDHASSWEAYMVYLWNMKFALYTVKTLWSDVRLRILDFWNNDFKTIFDTTIAGTMTMMSACKLTGTQDKLLFVYESGADMRYSLYWNTEEQFVGVARENASAAASVQVVFSWVATISGLTAWLPYFVWDAGAVATTGTYRIGVAKTTGTLLIN